MRRFPALIAAAVAVVAGTATLGTVAAPAASGAVPAEAQGEDVPNELFSPDGSIRRVQVDVDSQPEALAPPRAPATVTAVEINGPSDNRIDMVFLGDGYTDVELGEFADQVKDKWELLADREPFTAYRELFNVWRVDIVSPVSGVSGDPTEDVVRDTPLGMTFWCGGLERLLCADIDSVHRYAALAPDVDQIAVLANSTKYGGAGYTNEEVATFSGGNELAGEVLPHELGHSLGDLADEYNYYAYPGDGSTYTGPEPAAVNVTTFTAYQMATRHAKWWYWLGAKTPDGGRIGAYEGGNYHQYGIYRPSKNSLMKALGEEYNSVGREKMIQSFYAIASPIDSVTREDEALTRGEAVSVRTVPADMKIRWYVEDREIRSWRGETTVRVRGWAMRRDALTVKVTDTNPWVRNDDYRRTYLTETHTWRLARH